ncbi:MAG: hypothetical protein K2X37_00125 [Chitinophagaceae bacterium]|nr:hypothetical protein [Chitinophagaceae bacterium]
MSSDTVKKVWTENDFEQMSWHDCKIYAMAFGVNKNEVIFDIDFVLKWSTPSKDQEQYNFLVAPATLIFKNVYNINIDVTTTDITIDGIYRENPAKPKNAAHIIEQVEYDWYIETNNGEISFKSVGFTQHLRKESVYSSSQSLDLNQRGGIVL